MSNLQTIIQTHFTTSVMAMMEEVKAQTRAEVLAEIGRMPMSAVAELVTGRKADGLPILDGSGLKAEWATTPDGDKYVRIGAAHEPVKRGPGRPKVAAAKAEPKKAGRLARRGPEAIAETLKSITALLAKHPNGLRSEQIGKELGLKKELPRPLKDGLASGALTKSGEKRATIYRLAGATKTPGKGLPKKKAAK